MELFCGRGFTVIGAPWSGKTTAGKIATKKLQHKLRQRIFFHDMDNHGLEGRYGWGKGGVKCTLEELGDDSFLKAEGKFTVDNYGSRDEGKVYNLDTMLFSSTGSLPLSEDAMKHVRDRSTVILLEVPIDILVNRASPSGRPDGNSRIVGMNGNNPMFKTLRETLEYRGGIYKQSADIVLPYREECPSETGSRLADLILNYDK